MLIIARQPPHVSRGLAVGVVVEPHLDLAVLIWAYAIHLLGVAIADRHELKEIAELRLPRERHLPRVPIEPERLVGEACKLERDRVRVIGRHEAPCRREEGLTEHVP